MSEATPLAQPEPVPATVTSSGAPPTEPATVPTVGPLDTLPPEVARAATPSELASILPDTVFFFGLELEPRHYISDPMTVGEESVVLIGWERAQTDDSALQAREDGVFVVRQDSDGAWRTLASVEISSGIFDVANMVQVGELTGDGRPEVLITQAWATANTGSVLSDEGGTWHAMMFSYRDDLIDAIAGESPGIQDGALVAFLQECSCAAGGPATFVWKFRGDGTFEMGDVISSEPPAWAEL